MLQNASYRKNHSKCYKIMENQKSEKKLKWIHFVPDPFPLKWFEPFPYSGTIPFPENETESIHQN